jgi:hypothetical protein
VEQFFINCLEINQSQMLSSSSETQNVQEEDCTPEWQNHKGKPDEVTAVTWRMIMN